MSDIIHDGCVGCKYEKIGENILPCKACRGSINFNSPYRDKIADLYEPIDKPIEKEKKKLPRKIDRFNFDRQLESFSIKAIIQQLKYLAIKVNEIIDFLENE